MLFAGSVTDVVSIIEQEIASQRSVEAEWVSEHLPQLLI